MVPFVWRKLHTLFLYFFDFFSKICFSIFFFKNYFSGIFVSFFYRHILYIFVFYFRILFSSFFLEFFFGTCEILFGHMWKKFRNFFVSQGKFFLSENVCFFFVTKKKVSKKKFQKKIFDKKLWKRKIRISKKEIWKKKIRKKQKKQKFWKKKIEKKVRDGRCNFLQTTGTIYVIYPKDVECNFSNPQGSFI